MPRRKITSNALLIGRGERIKQIRELLKISSEELAKLVQFSRQSISYWENGRQNGLSYEGALACKEALKTEGIECDLNWLWMGEGPEPYKVTEGIRETRAYYDSLKCLYPNDIREEEIKLFKQNSGSVVMLVNHNAMQPLYQIDDWIGGFWQTISPKLMGQACIIKIKNHLEVRFLKRRSKRGYHFSLMTYLGDTIEAFEIIEATGTQIAPVVRVWRDKLMRNTNY